MKAHTHTHTLVHRHTQAPIYRYYYSIDAQPLTATHVRVVRVVTHKLALLLLHPLTDKPGSPLLQHCCWSHLLHIPHTEAQLWIWNGTLECLVLSFPLHHNGSWGLSHPSRWETTSDFLYKICIRRCNMYP